MKCPYCGAENSEEDIYCGECGRSIEEQRRKKKQFPGWGIAIVVLTAAFVGGCVGFVFWGYLEKGQTGSDEVEVEMTIEEQERYDDAVSDPETESMLETDNIWREDNEESSFENGGSVQNNMGADSEFDAGSDIQPGTDMYILPQSNKEYLTNEDVEGLSLKEINYVKNEIYARHGRKFQSEELQRYFNSKPWYEGLYEAEDFDDNYSSRMLNDYEKENAEFLRKKEYSISLGGYELDH